MSTIVRFTVSLDPEAVADAIQSTLEGDMPSLDGVGVDGDSSYEVSDVEVSVNKEGTFSVVARCERIEGKFASRDDLTEEALDMIAGATIEVEIIGEDADMS